jgi:replicative DNA helicase
VLFPLRGGPLGLDVGGKPDEHSACLVVAKNRNGRVGIAPIEWTPHTASYRLGVSP